MKTTTNNIITTIDELHYADVEAMNVDTLKATCKALGITGYSRLNKNALQTILLEAIDERINQQCQANLAWCDEMSARLESTCTCGHDATSERLAAAITAGLVYVIVTTTCDMQGASYLQADIAERLTITEAIAVAAQTRHDYDMWLLAYAADHTEATIEQLGTEQAIRLVHDRDTLIDLTYVTAAHIEQLSLAEAETIEEATEEQPTITIGTEAIDQVWDAINANSGERNHEMVLSYETALNRSCGNVARLSTESILTILGTDDIYGIRGSVREAVISARNILNFCGADESIAAQAVRELIAEKAAQAGAITITKPEATKTEPSTDTLAEAVHELAAKRDALDAAEHDVFRTKYTMGVTPEQVAKAVERRDGIAAQYEDAKRRVDALSSALDTKATEDEATETLTITTERQHIASIDAHVYIERDGSYVYQDMCGYRTYKTLQGLNRYVQSAAKTANRKAPEIVEATEATKVAADATKQATKSVKAEATTEATTYTTDQLAEALEAAGLKRWTKRDMDRMYANPSVYGVSFDYYKSGNISSCTVTIDGEEVRVSNAEGGRFKSTKAYVDLADASVHVRTATDYEDHIAATLEAIVAEAIATITTTTTEATDESADQPTEAIEVETIDGTVRVTGIDAIEAIGGTISDCYATLCGGMAEHGIARVTWLRGDEVVAETRADREPNDGTDEDETIISDEATTTDERTDASLTDEQANELYHLRFDMAWSWWELANRYGIDEREARRVYNRIHADKIAEANGIATTETEATTADEATTETVSASTIGSDEDANDVDYEAEFRAKHRHTTCATVWVPLYGVAPAMTAAALVPGIVCVCTGGATETVIDKQASKSGKTVTLTVRGEHGTVGTRRRNAKTMVGVRGYRIGGTSLWDIDWPTTDEDEATTTTVDADGEVADEGTTVDERGEVVESDEKAIDLSHMNTAAWQVACDCCLSGTGCNTDHFANNYIMRSDVDAALTENVRDARGMVADCIDHAAEYLITGEEVEALADELRMLDEWLADHANNQRHIAIARDVVAFTNDVDPYQLTTEMRDGLESAAVELAADLTQCVAWLENQIYEYDDEEARELLARVRAALDADELRMLDVRLDENEGTRLVGTIERDGYTYPVTYDEDGYHVDLGGVTGISDGLAFDGDAEALEGIADIIDREAEDMATETDENTYRYFAYVSRMALVEYDERYIERNEDENTGRYYSEDWFETEEDAIAFVKAEMADYVDRELGGKGYKVIRTRRGLDTIEYCDGTVERHYVDADGEVIDYGDDPSTEHYYRDGFYESSLPDEVRDKAERIMRGYHDYLDYEADCYDSLADELAE